MSPQAPLASLTPYTLPTASSTPVGVAVGPENAIWLTESAAGKVATLAWLPSSQPLTLDHAVRPFRAC